MKHTWIRIFGFCLVLGNITFSAFGSKTQHKVLAMREEVFEYKNTPFQLNEQGGLYLGRPLKTIEGIEEDMIQSIQKIEDTLYLGGGSPSRLISYSLTNQKTETLFEAKGITFRSLFVQGKNLFFVEFPTNTLYVLDTETKEVQIVTQFQEENYIWSITGDEQGNLYLATGAKAKIYKLSFAEGQTEPKVESILTLQQERHILRVQWHQNQLYFTTQGYSGLYSYDLESQKLSMLAHTYEQDVPTFFIHKESGDIYFATASAIPLPVPNDLDYTDSTSLSRFSKLEQMTNQGMSSVRDENAKGAGGKPSFEHKNSVYRYSSGKLEKLFTKDGVRFQDIFERDGSIYVGTSDGRIFSYEIESQQLFYDIALEHKNFLAFYPDENEFFIGSGKDGFLYSLEYTPASEGEIISKAIDLGGPSLLGQPIPTYEGQEGSITISIRQGALPFVDSNWSDWVEVYPNAEGKNLLKEMPMMQYMQYKITMRQNAQDAPVVLYSLDQSYRPYNTPPIIESFYAYYVADMVQMQNENQDNLSSRMGGEISKSLVQMEWNVSDKESDTLEYEIQFHTKENPTWIPFLEDVSSNQISFDSMLLPDGEYTFVLLARDELDNDEADISVSRKTTPVFVIDNHPPQIQMEEVKIQGNTLSIQAKVLDKATSVSGVYYRIQEGKWKYLPPADKILDQLEEEISYSVELNEEDMDMVNKTEKPVLFIEAVDQRGNRENTMWNIQKSAGSNDSIGGNP